MKDIQVSDGKLIISVDLEELLDGQAERYLPFYIKDVDKMIKWLKENDFFDCVFDEAYAQGNAWLESIIIKGE